MTVAEDRLKAGDLDGARQALQEAVRKEPAKAELRVFLFQLLCVCGEWERALTQLRVCGELDGNAMPMVQTYREAIGCEMVRARVFAGETAPLVMGDPPNWLALLIQALGALARGEAEAAADLRARAFEEAPATSGSIDGKSFGWIADADMRLGPVLELIVNGRYFWAPVSTVKFLSVEEPADLRDAVWLPVEVTWANGGQMPALMPTRYPGTETQEKAALRLSRATEWRDLGAETWAGYGQRLLATDAEDHAVMDMRRLALDVEIPQMAEQEEPGGG